MMLVVYTPTKVRNFKQITTGATASDAVGGLFMHLQR